VKYTFIEHTSQITCQYDTWFAKYKITMSVDNIHTSTVTHIHYPQKHMKERHANVSQTDCKSNHSAMSACHELQLPQNEKYANLPERVKCMYKPYHNQE